MILKNDNERIVYGLAARIHPHARTHVHVH